MIKTIIVISLVFTLMTIVIFFVIKNTIDIIKEKGKLYFTLKIQEYEESKKEEDKIEEEEKEEKDKSDASVIQNYDKKDNKIIYLESNRNYELDEVFKIVKAVENSFKVDSEKLIRNFIETKVDNTDDKLYESLLKIKEKIKEIGVYNILTADEEFITQFINDLKKENEQIIDKYMSISNSFDINDFINYVNSEIDKNNPTVYVLVGQESDNYDNIDKRIKTIYRSNIYKGFEIIYKNKMYDYSLN